MHLTRRKVSSLLIAAPPLMVNSALAHGNNWRTRGFDKLTSMAEKLITDDYTPGIAVGISARGFRKSAYFGVANISTKTPVTEQTRFRIASVTKPITAACILKLIEAGDLSLNSTLGEFFPDFPRSSEVTIYHLLTHTSGIGNWWGRMPARTPPNFLNNGDANQWLAKMDPLYLFNPGEKRDYSNSGYVLLGEIIEQVTGQSFEVALNKTVLSRVGAGKTELERVSGTKSIWARGYVSEHEQIVPSPDVLMPFAAGGLRAPLHDVLAFSDALFHGMFLSAESLGEMTAHARVDDGKLVEDAAYQPAPPETNLPNVTEMGYGLGINTWVQSAERFYSHAGLIDGFGAYLVYSPRTRTTVAMMANITGGTSPLHQLARDILIAGPDQLAE